MSILHIIENKFLEYAFHATLSEDTASGDIERGRRAEVVEPQTWPARNGETVEASRDSPYGLDVLKGTSRNRKLYGFFTYKFYYGKYKGFRFQFSGFNQSDDLWIRIHHQY